jgi:hypothetical protein
MKQFRDSFFKHFGIEQADIILVNDGMSIEKTVAVTASSETSSDTEESSTIGESMSGKEVLSCICEINGCMGHMGRDGKFHYIYLEQEIQGLYPRNDLYPADDLFPRDPKSTQIGKGFYVTATYEDYLVKITIPHFFMNSLPFVICYTNHTTNERELQLKYRNWIPLPCFCFFSPFFYNIPICLIRIKNRRNICFFKF